MHHKGKIPSNKFIAFLPDLLLLCLWVVAISQFYRDLGIDEAKRTEHYFDPYDFPVPPKSVWFAGAGLAIVEA